MTIFKGGAHWLVASAAALLCAASAVGPISAHAQSGVTSSLNDVRSSSIPTSQSDVEYYWTPDRLLNAKPLELHPRVGSNGLPIVIQSPLENARPEHDVGAPPSVSVSPSESRILIPQAYLLELQSESGVVPEATSSFGAYFTTGRVSPDAATTTFPYRAAGKLFFSDPKTGGNFICSASVLRPRVIVTAGHCVTKPNTDPTKRYFYSKFLFVPAYNNGVAPYKSWTPSTEWVTNTWYFSNGSVPNAQDVAMLVAKDQLFGTRVLKIGQVTGWLGYLTNALAKNNATMLGYPGNLDNAQRMEFNNAQTFESGGNNTYVYGSAMRGGSSGGPWIQDFGIAPVSNPAVSLGNNYLIAVTSYGPIATTPLYQGASNLDSRFVSLLSSACGPATSGNC